MCALSILVAFLPIAGQTPAGPFTDLTAAPVVLDLDAGASNRLFFTVTPDRPWRIAVEQIGIDVAVAVADADGQVLATVDRPLDRSGVEYVFLRAETSRPYSVEIRSLVATAPAGRVRVSVEDLSWSTPAERSRWLGEKAESEAAAAYARGGAEGRREALAGYRRALFEWERAGDAERQALAVYSIGVLHRLLGEAPQGLEYAQRSVSLFTSLDERRWRASALNEVGLLKITLGDLEAGRRAFEQALELLESAPDPFRQAVAQSNVCLVALHLGALREGIDCYERAQSLYDSAGDPQSQAMSLSNSGRAYDILGEPDRALASYQRALEVQRASGETAGQALTLNNLALLVASQGDAQSALEFAGGAIDLYRGLDNRVGLALALTNMGTAYWKLGEFGRARSYYEEALSLQRESENRRGEAHTLSLLGEVLALEGDTAAAETMLMRALDLRRQIQHRRGEGRVLVKLGRLRAANGEWREALDLFEQVLALAMETEDQELWARAEHRLGEALAGQGRIPDADSRFRAAFERYRSIRDPDGEAAVLTSMAQLARTKGDIEAARGHLSEAISRIEARRARIASPELKATLLASHRTAYELDIEILMKLHEAEPSRGFDAQALAASERARARSLLELLGESTAGIVRGIDPELRIARQRLHYRLDAAEGKRLKLVGGPHTAMQLTERESEIETILAELDRLEGRIRDVHPEFSSLVRPAVLRARQIQVLLDSETALLVYSLGGERSFLWWVTRDGVASWALPQRSTIEALARRVHQGLSTLDPSTAREEYKERAELSRMILGPVANRLRDQRLVVVADGALHHIPFATLPRPDAAGLSDELLIRRHEITNLPSASALAVQRESYAGRRPASRRALLVADPVFGADDPRLGGGESQSSVAPDPPTVGAANREVRQLDQWQLGRLPGTRREAQAIAALAPPDEVQTALGFDASLDTLARADLSSFQLVHFATHGLINDRSPRLSGLALSRFDARGRPAEGFLNLDRIYNLELAADLVVLSACETASGREIRGEGLIGLTHGFMYAGAPRVMASLWRIQDRATAELMEHFYRSIWVEGQSPAAALREAQLELLAESRWRDPYYWGSFVVQGDWRWGAG